MDANSRLKNQKLMESSIYTQAEGVQGAASWRGLLCRFLWLSWIVEMEIDFFFSLSFLSF